MAKKEPTFTPVQIGAALHLALYKIVFIKQEACEGGPPVTLPASAFIRKSEWIDFFVEEIQKMESIKP